MMVSWLIILFLVLVFVDSLIVLAVKGSTAGRIIAGVIGGVIFLVLFFGFFISVPVTRSVERGQQVQQSARAIQQQADEIRRRGEDIRLRGEEMRNGVVRVGSSNGTNVQTTFSEVVATPTSHGAPKRGMTFVTLPLLVVGGGLLVGLIVLVVKGGTAGKVIGGVILGGVLLFAMSSVFHWYGVLSSMGAERGDLALHFQQTLMKLVVVGGLIVGVIMLAVKGGKAGKVVAGGILLVAMFLGLRFFGVQQSEQAQRNAIASGQQADEIRRRGEEIRSRSEETLNGTRRRIGPGSGEHFVTSDPDVVWSDGVEEVLDADVYSSKKMAMVGLAREIGRAIEVRLDHSEGPLVSKNIHVHAPWGKISGHLIGELQKALMELMPDFEVSAGKFDGEMDRSWLWVDVALEDESQENIFVGEIQQGNVVHMSQAVGQAMQSGRFVANIDIAEYKEIRSVEFSEKPWLTETSRFAASTGRHWKVAKSSEACISEQQANNEAMGSAYRMMEREIKATIPFHSGPGGEYVTENDLIEHGFISDSFTQSFSGSAGRIWRKAILLDVSPERLRILAGRKTVMVKYQRSELLNQILTLAGVISLICLVYFFLNAATKGYYSWAMRFAAVVLILAGIFIVLMMS